MAAEQITVFVDSDVANAYRSAPDDERRKLDLLVSLCLRDATRSKASLKEIMCEISQMAQERGTPSRLLELIGDQSTESET